VPSRIDPQDLLSDLMARTPRRRRPRRRWLRNLLLFCLGVAIAAGLCAGSVCRVYIMSGDAMAPTLRDGDRVLVVWARGGSETLRNRLVLFQSPVLIRGNRDLNVKRVVGVAGDTIEVRDGELLRNGRVADEPYLAERMDYNWGPLVCPPGNLIVLGDNRNESLDSHSWTQRGKDGVIEPAPLVPVELVQGIVAMVVFPPGRISIL